MGSPQAKAAVAAWGLALSLSLGRPAGGASLPPPGAAACSGCHSVNPQVTTEVPRLIGRKPADIVAALEDFKAGRRPATVMDRIAKGFSDGEIEAIAAWYGARRK
jgi:cytochrome c553